MEIFRGPRTRVLWPVQNPSGSAGAISTFLRLRDRVPRGPTPLDLLES